MKRWIRWIRAVTGAHTHRWHLGEEYCREPGCSARRVVGKDDMTLSILETALRQRDIEDLALWLMVPRQNNGRTPASLLATGDYNRVRMLAITRAPHEVGAMKRRPTSRPPDGARDSEV